MKPSQYGGDESSSIKYMVNTLFIAVKQQILIWLQSEQLTSSYYIYIVALFYSHLHCNYDLNIIFVKISLIFML